MTTLRDALDSARQRLAQSSDNPMLDAEVLLAHVLNHDRSYLRAWPDRELEPALAESFEGLVARRAAGEPVAHLTGRREFWSLALEVTPDTLIPRPETELLVELVLERIPAAASSAIADLGTGSGNIALAIAHARPNAAVTATDRSRAALEVARRNARHLGINNVDFRLGDWCAPLTGHHFDVIVSNPPYIPLQDPHLEAGDVRFEPRLALTAGAEGLDDIRRIAEQAIGHLNTGGWLIVEHGYDQAESVPAILEAVGFQEVTDFQDFEKRPRACVGRKPA